MEEHEYSCKIHFSKVMFEAGFLLEFSDKIGVKKDIIIVDMGFIDGAVFNSVITKMDTSYEMEEGCL